MPSDIHQKWRAYANTILEFLCPHEPLRIDLRRPLDTVSRDALASIGIPVPFAIFTAENPEGQHVEDAPTPDAEARRERENDARMARLGQALRDASLPWRRVDGVAPDGSYREHCVAVPIPRDEAAGLATRLRQLALFWFDGTRFWLLPAAADERPEPLPR